MAPPLRRDLYVAPVSADDVVATHVVPSARFRESRTSKRTTSTTRPTVRTLLQPILGELLGTHARDLHVFSGYCIISLHLKQLAPYVVLSPWSIIGIEELFTESDTLASP